jgi:hypothetical protein
MLKQMAATIVTVLCAAWCQGREAGSDPDRLRTYELDIFGPSAEAAVKQAELHAVRSAIGEFYCSDEMMLARALLARYAEKYYRRFVASEKILSRRESQGMVYLRVKIILDVRALEKDLREKQFFYKPKRRPVFYVTIAETVDNAATSSEPISRAAIHEALKQLILDEKKIEQRVVYSQAPNLDLTKDEQQMTAAREAAQRAGVEVILTGSVDLRLSREKKIHFDDYAFYDAWTTLTLIRVDDGQVLGAANYEAGAGHNDKTAAKRVAASRATTKILQDLIPKFAERWERTVTDNAEFQVMVVGVNAAEADVVQDRLATRLTGAEVHRRSLFEDVAVFNIYYPVKEARPGERERIEQVLGDIVAPRFKLTPTKNEKYIHARRVS